MAAFPSPGDSIGRFRVLAQLGAGGMGVVYEALEETLERRVALKVIAPAFADDPDFRERFGREARALAALESQQVVKVYAHGEEDGYLYIATQLVPDGDLGAMLAESGPPPLGAGLALAAQVAAGLADAHAAGLVHRDIKPGNVLVSRGTSGGTVRAYLSDFGIARRADAEHTQLSSAAIGTPDYLAPELYRGLPASTGTDLFALGCLTWAILLGRPPYDDVPAADVIDGHATRTPPQLDGGSPLVAAANRVLATALADDPSRRYASAAELRDDLRAAARMAGDPEHDRPARAAAVAATPVPAASSAAPAPAATPAAATPAPAGSGEPRRRPPWVPVAAAAVGLLVGVAAMFALTRGDDDGDQGEAAPQDDRLSSSAQEFVDLDAKSILAAMERDMAVLDAVRYTVDIEESTRDKYSHDLSITTRGECDGVLDDGFYGQSDLRRWGGTTYLRPDQRFLRNHAVQGKRGYDTDVVLQRAQGRWLQVSGPRYTGFSKATCELERHREFRLGDRGGLDDTSATKGDLDYVDGRLAIPVFTQQLDYDGKGGNRNVTALVAVDAPHHLLQLDAEGERIDYSQFDVDPDVEFISSDESVPVEDLVRPRG